MRVAATGGAHARLTLSRAQVLREAELAFDVRFRSAPTGGTAISLVGTRTPVQRFGTIYALIGASRYVVHHAFLQDDPGTTQGYGQTPLKLSPEVGRWQRWDLRLRFEPAPPTVELLIDGEVAAAGPMHASFTASPLSFDVGTPFADNLQIDIDNVRIDGR